MGRDKARDDKFFNCMDEHEVNYVVGLYEDHDKIRDFLRKKCEDKSIHYSTNLEVYQLIEKELGQEIPIMH